jgi:hypothetical protein
MLAVMFASACRGGSDPAASPPPPAPLAGGSAALPPAQMQIRDLIAALTIFKDAACKCADDACTENIVGAIRRWSEESRKALSNQVPTDAEKKQLQSLTTELSRCTKYEFLSIGSSPR